MTTLGPIGTINKPRLSAWWLSGGISAANCIAAYQPKGAASLAASYVNLANPGTYNAAPGVAPTFDANGWTFDGIAQYLVTGIVPVKQLWTMIILFSGHTPAAGKYLAATRNTLPTYGIGTAANSVVYYSGSSASAIHTMTGNHSAAVSGNQGYWDGVSDAGVIGDAGVTMGTKDIYIGCRNADGSAAGFSAVTIKSMAIYNIALIAAQVLAVHNAVIAL